MDIASVIIGLVSLALFIVPVIYIQGKQKKAEIKLQEDFLNVAGQQQLVISQHELWNHRFAIGIDTSQSKLFYLKKGEEGEQKVLINLSEVTACSLINMNREVSGNKVIDLLGLRFTFCDPRLSDETVEFYNRNESMSLNDELKLSEKWKTIVNASLQAPQQQKANGNLKGGALAYA